MRGYGVGASEGALGPTATSSSPFGMTACRGVGPAGDAPGRSVWCRSRPRPQRVRNPTTPEIDRPLRPPRRGNRRVGSLATAALLATAVAVPGPTGSFNFAAGRRRGRPQEARDDGTVWCWATWPALDPSNLPVSRVTATPEGDARSSDATRISVGTMLCAVIRGEPCAARAARRGGGAPRQQQHQHARGDHRRATNVRAGSRAGGLGRPVTTGRCSRGRQPAGRSPTAPSPTDLVVGCAGAGPRRRPFLATGAAQPYARSSLTGSARVAGATTATGRGSWRLRPRAEPGGERDGGHTLQGVS